MGGGAGIVIEIGINHADVRRAKNNIHKFVVVKPFEIQSFNMKGYMDGMDNIDPRMLKVTGIAIDPMDDADAAWFARNASWPLSTMCLELDDHDVLKDVAFRGYVRGDWNSIFPRTYNTKMYGEWYGSLDVAITIDLADPERFKYFYEDVFNCSIEDPDEVELFWQDCEVNYGATV